MKTKQNQGLALPVILLLLLVMTILGVTSLSSSTLQERMAAGQRLREIAFNFAETTLREGEIHAKSIAGQIREGTLTTQAGTDFTFFSTDFNNLNNPFWKLGFPSLSQANSGDNCTGGYCTPIEFDSTEEVTGVAPDNIERWLDATVWADPERHRVLEAFDAGQLAEQDMAEQPKYIIELLGQLPLQTQEGNPSSVDVKCEVKTVPNDGYPYCIQDPYFFRITARAVSGIGGRTSVVMLQSTIVIDQ